MGGMGSGDGSNFEYLGGAHMGSSENSNGRFWATNDGLPLVASEPTPIATKTGNHPWGVLLKSVLGAVTLVAAGGGAYAIDHMHGLFKEAGPEIVQENVDAIGHLQPSGPVRAKQANAIIAFGDRTNTQVVDATGKIDPAAADAAVTKTMHSLKTWRGAALYTARYAPLQFAHDHISEQITPAKSDPQDALKQLTRGLNDATPGYSK